jgi:hypothetical protein
VTRGSGFENFLRGRLFQEFNLLADRSEFPNADDEYTPAQRRAMDARLDESQEDLEQNRTFGPFNSAAEMISHMKGQLKKSGARRVKR